jgi:hypothetical protein
MPLSCMVEKFFCSALNTNGMEWNGTERAAKSNVHLSAGCGVTAGVLVVGLLAFKQVCGGRLQAAYLFVSIHAPLSTSPGQAPSTASKLMLHRGTHSCRRR